MNHYDHNALAKLRWACRRGMLELDLFLQPFFDTCFLLLSDAQQQDFIELLTYSDPELFAWLMGHQTPPTAALTTLCGTIREHAQKNVST